MTTWQQASTYARAAFLENIALKVLALVGSMGLFTVVHGSEAGQRSLYVPVVAELPPSEMGKVLVSELPDRVKLTLSGSRSVLNSIQSVETVQIDLSSADQYYYFEPEIFGLPAGIDVAVVPSTLVLDWEDRVERTLPLRAQRAGELPEGLKVVMEPTAKPPRVRISGPRSVMQSMNEVLTDPVDVAVAGVGQHMRRARLSALPQGVQVMDTREINVRFAVAALENERKINRLEVAPLGVAGNVRLRPVRVNVVISGPEKALKELESEHVVPTVDLSGVSLPPGSNIPVKVEVRGLPPGIRVARVEPAEVLAAAR